MNVLLHYTGSVLDRADHIRRDEEQLETLWRNPKTVVVPLFELNNLICSRTGEAVMHSRAELGEIAEKYTHRCFLGLLQGVAVFTIGCDEADALPWLDINSEYHMVDLRVAGPRLPSGQASILAYARGINHWQRQTRFCSVCGSALASSNGGHVLSCGESSVCARQWFPRTDPAVIMLVERTGADGERYCLLGRSPAWPEQVYSTLAGFVETGESLEEAVAREVFEESGISVNNVRYVASQPWPFPQSIMLGFAATATSTEISIDTEELADARWFSATQIATFGDWGDDSDGPKLPRPDSIARHLIDMWLRSTEAQIL